MDVFYPLYVPTAFTPNNDGVNDVFMVEGIDPRGFWLEIYNRWGEQIFYTEDPNAPWNGNNQLRDSDHFVPDGVYHWPMRNELCDLKENIEKFNLFEKIRYYKIIYNKRFNTWENNIRESDMMTRSDGQQ